jgi:hypothetical protein
MNTTVDNNKISDEGLEFRPITDEDIAAEQAQQTYEAEKLREAGLSPERYRIEQGRMGRIQAVHKVSGRRITIGILTDDDEIIVTKPVKKHVKTDADKKCVNFYVDSDFYKRLTRAALLQGETVSGYVRGLVETELDNLD